MTLITLKLDNHITNVYIVYLFWYMICVELRKLHNVLFLNIIINIFWWFGRGVEILFTPDILDFCISYTRSASHRKTALSVSLLYAYMSSQRNIINCCMIYDRDYVISWLQNHLLMVAACRTLLLHQNCWFLWKCKSVCASCDISTRRIVFPKREATIMTNIPRLKQ